MSDLGLLVLRLSFGLTLAFAHGLGKLPLSDGFIEGVRALGFPLPFVFAWAAALSEFLGGIGLALGVCTRVSALFVAVTMAVAAFMQHASDPFHTKEMALLFLFSAVALGLTGAGRFSIDALLRGRKGR